MRWRGPTPGADRPLVGVDGLDDTDILVMDYVIVWTEKRGRSEVTRPCRDVADHAGISKDTAYRRLKALTERRLLILVSCGHASKKQFSAPIPSHRRKSCHLPPR